MRTRCSSPKGSGESRSIFPAGAAPRPPRRDHRGTPRGEKALGSPRDAGRGGGKFVLEGAAAVHDPGSPAGVDRGRRGATRRQREGAGKILGGSRRASWRLANPARPRRARSVSDLAFVEASDFDAAVDLTDVQKRRLIDAIDETKKRARRNERAPTARNWRPKWRVSVLRATSS